ncbi:M12 family metallopeptidase [Tenacibaculum sp. C7A-26P2]|uniref:M12 family metallopeptidase n=1 Tax=Tenacibaculum sp. C7A-26P2 TaxID=3447504 RepID=UPI003F868EF3
MKLKIKTKLYFFLYYSILVLFTSCYDDKGVFTDIKKDNLTNNEKIIIGESLGNINLYIDKHKEDNFLILLGDMLIPKSSVNILKIYNVNEFEIEDIDNDIAYFKKKYSTETTKLRSSINSNILYGAELWEGRWIHFAFNDKNNFSKKQYATIFKAMSHWANKTNMRFKIVPANSHLKKITIFKKSSGCNCSVGSVEGSMNLSLTCDFQSIVHEIGHAVGFGHEHQRPKRDSYLANFHTNKDYQFIKEGMNKLGENGKSIVATLKANLSKESVYDDSLPFDYNSVMLYGSWPRNHLILRDFLKRNNLPVYTHLNGDPVERPNFGLTSIDIRKTYVAYRGL